MAKGGSGSLALPVVLCHIVGMDREIDLKTADRDVLIAIIVRQQAIIERLEKRIAQLEGRAKPGGSRGMPGLKPKASRKPAQPTAPRKSRPHGFARTRMTPTQRVEHAVAQCPDCGTRLSGGWVQRTREVIDVPPVPAEVSEHVYIARTCPACRRRCLPPAQLEGMVMGKQRLGVNLVSLIAMLREEARLPIGVIQGYLRIVHQLRLSVGAIVDAVQRTAQKAQAAAAEILTQIRASPVVHADETGWRQDGNNGYVWTFSTPTQRYFPCSSQGQALRRGRGKAVVDEVLGAEFAGVLVSDFYAAYHHYDGPKQRCWATCCGTSTTCELSTLMMRHWRGGLTPSMNFTSRPKPSPIISKSRAAPRNWPWNGGCWPSANPSWTTRRPHPPDSADASSATSKACPVLDTGNSSSSWPNRKRLPTTTPPSAACATWSSVVRSAAAPGRNGAPTAR